MLGRVSGRLERHEPQSADGERFLVADVVTAPLVRQLGPRPDYLLCAGDRGELAGTRDVVVVEVRLDDVRDAQVALMGSGEVDVDVAPRVDDGCETGVFVGDQRREMAQPFDLELSEEHRPRITSSRGRRRRRAPAQ